MKLKQLTKIVAVSTFGYTLYFLTSCKDTTKETTSTTNTPSVETTTNTTHKAPKPTTSPVYIVTVFGYG